MGILGLAVVVGAIVWYGLMVFVVHTFTYRTWIFDSAVAIGMVLALVGWATDGPNLASGIALVAVLFGSPSVEESCVYVDLSNFSFATAIDSRR